MTLPPSLPYQSPPAHTRRASGLFDWNTFVRTLLIVGAAIAILFFVIPRFQKTFVDFKIELPASTQALFSLQRAVVDGWWMALLAIPPGLAFLVAQFGPVGRRLARTLIVLAFGAFVLFVVAGIFQPLLKLVDSMTSSK